MRIGIDLTVTGPNPSGVGRYLDQLIRALGAIDRDDEYLLFINREDRGGIGTDLPRNFKTIAWSMRPRPQRAAHQHLFMPAASLARSIDVIHSPSFIMPAFKANAGHVLTVHDTIYFSMAEIGEIRLHQTELFRWQIRRAVRRAEEVIVPTEYVKDDLARWVPEVDPDRITAIPHGVGAEFVPRPKEEVEAALKRLGIEPPYLLHVGDLQPRKNLERLIDAFARISDRRAGPISLVLAGNLRWSYDPIVERARDLGGGVVLPGYVPSELLPALYSGAIATVYPSLEEGFGIPPLESMSCGVPVLAGDHGATAENLEGAAELVDVTDTGAVAAGLRRLLDNPRRREELSELGKSRAAAFTWERSATAHLDCYRGAAARSARRRQRGRIHRRLR